MLKNELSRLFLLKREWKNGDKPLSDCIDELKFNGFTNVDNRNDYKWVE